MNDVEESDRSVVPASQPNKAEPSAAEVGEGRGRTKENTSQSHTLSTQGEVGVSQGLRGVRQAARERKRERFTALLHHLNVDLAHGEDEGSGRSFMMLEGTDAKVHCIYHTPQMAEARGRGGLRANRFVRLRKLFENGWPRLEIEELGHSEKILSDRRHQEELAARFLQRGTSPAGCGWGGWLGRYQAALHKAAAERARQIDPLEQTLKPHRERDRSLVHRFSKT
jgi:hypothetical protein